MTHEEMLGMIGSKVHIFPELACSDGNAEEMGANDEILFEVLGGKLPFTWEITGAGFTLGTPAATGRENTVKTEEVACGTGIITVTDDNEEEIECKVRCTVGVWRARGSISCGAGYATSDHIEYIDPAHRWRFWFRTAGS